MYRTDEKVIYEEKIFSKGITGILIVTTVLLILVWFYLFSTGITSILPFLNCFFLFLSLLLISLTVNFRNLTIKMTSQNICISYGILKHKIFWKDVENCYVDDTSTLTYGGRGLRIELVKGKWRIVYSVIGGHRVVLSLRKGRFREFVFSTQKPEEVMFLIKQQIKILKI